jgi:hypothetical protein
MTKAAAEFGCQNDKVTPSMGGRCGERCEVPIAATDRRDDIAPQEARDLKIKDRQAGQVDCFYLLAETVARFDEAALVIVLEAPKRRSADLNHAAAIAPLQFVLAQVERVKRRDPIIGTNLLDEKPVRSLAREDRDDECRNEADGIYKAVEGAALRRCDHRYPRDR